MLNMRVLIGAVLAGLLWSGHSFAYEPKTAKQQQLLDYYYAALAGSPELLDGALAEDWRSVDPIPGQNQGREAYKVLAVQMYENITDYNWVVENMIEEDDTVVVRSTFTGLHSFSMYGEEPTNEPFEIKSIEIHHFNSDGLVYLSYHVDDWAKMLEQVGVLPVE